MPANVTPIFVLTPFANTLQVSAANANRDGTGTIVDGRAAGTNGSRYDHIEIHATVTTTAGMIRIYVHNGSTYKLWKEVAVAAVTGSASVAEFAYDLVRADGLPLITLPTGYKLAYSTHNAEAINVVEIGGDY